MYKLTLQTLNNLEAKLKKFHDLFDYTSCNSLQLEELIAKSIQENSSNSDKIE
ncbi:hypothetical protein [Italian clover phyllody phytoplasma]|uniref:hypothetical protein n=1 Tax=Italian clover phyllody phytoplasma TaxID=1196420 RepID=UPI0003170C80|nr:hypothetical protein [Italian clover phyllody phytoplasma]